MNKLDEILEAYRSNLDNAITDEDFVLSKKFAKQAIIDWVDKEIIPTKLEHNGDIEYSYNIAVDTMRCNLTGTIAEKEQEKKNTHINPKCLNSRFCLPHNEFEDVSYDMEKIFKYIGELEQRQKLQKLKGEM